jgi:hypothetical protein
VIAVDDFLSTLLNLDIQQLPGLLSTVCDATALHVFSTKVRHVNEGHTTSIKAEQKEVAQVTAMCFPAIPMLSRA